MAKDGRIEDLIKPSCKRYDFNHKMRKNKNDFNKFQLHLSPKYREFQNL